MRRFPDPDPGNPDHRSPTSYLLWLAAYQRNALFAGALYGIVHVVAQALVPAAVGKAIDTGIIARDQRALLLWGGAVVVLGVVQATAGILRDRAALTTRLGASYRTAQHIARQAARLGAALPKRVAKGEIVNAGVVDIGRLGDALAETARGSGALVAIAVVAAILLHTSWQLGLVVLLGVPLMVGVVSLLIRPLHRRQQRLREQQAELTGRAVDIVSGLRVLRGIGGEEVFADRYRADSQRVRAAGVAVARVEALLDGAKVLLPGLLTTVVVWLGAHYVATGRMGAGQLVAFYGYAVFLVDPLRRLTNAAGRLTQGHVAARRITAFLALRPEFAPSAVAPAPYQGPAPLTDPASALTVAPGRFTAVACASPADAATLAARLGRYTDSAVTLGDTPLADLPPDEIRRRILVADNADRLFAGPLREELRGRGSDAGPDGRANDAGRGGRGRDAEVGGRGRDAAPGGRGCDVALVGRGSDAALERAVDAACARDIVEALPDGLDDLVEESGRNFSGGQQQRLRLVRALMADPEVLILIEPTSAVDAHTEARIAHGVGELRAGRTTLVFTTSPVVLDRADHVVYVQGAKAVAQGSHGDLLTDVRYRSVVAREETE
ncbi:ABC transporter transmembrane domain-containing protein [Streptomyces malaysiensis]|uniref:ABC transporter ATP-binding protein/permease n=1 Tax=Streptomyces malaysiensis subsp. samsunensis TaxID=459658 RepID=A0A9X2M5C4_STRMQ|nr:ABC transporter ATP-binding protein [Streptomyces samsunensis]MCQ8835713.1 ABC transporter ATP-binding protein/permease [Streptomyces samsunensis]